METKIISILIKESPAIAAICFIIWLWARERKAERVLREQALEKRITTMTKLVTLTEAIFNKSFFPDGSRRP